MSLSVPNPEMVTVFRNDSKRNVTVQIEFGGVSMEVSPHKVLTPGDSLSIPKFSADECIVVLVS